MGHYFVKLNVGRPEKDVEGKKLTRFSAHCITEKSTDSKLSLIAHEHVIRFTIHF